MADFQPIETQEDFDNAIKDRLNRQAEKHKAELAKYADYDDLKSKVADFETKSKDSVSKLEALTKEIEGYKSQIAEKDKAIKGYETTAIKTKIAAEIGLSNDAVSFISGDTEDDIRTSAEALKKVVGVRMDSPLASTVAAGKASPNSDAALRELARNLTK